MRREGGGGSKLQQRGRRGRALCESRPLKTRISRFFVLIRALGLPTLFAVCLPSYLVHVAWIPAGIVHEAKSIFEATDAIGAFITIVIVGSIASIERQVLIAGLARMALPLLLGSAAAAALGTLVGHAFGMGP